MNRTERRYAAGILILLAISRGAAYAAGVRFDAEPLQYYYQYLDPHLLQTSLLESVAHLHTQPPLFNLWLGIGLKIAPDNPAVFYHASFLALSALMSVAMFLTMARSRLPVRLSALLTAGFLVSPACILYENILFYTHPVVCFSVLAAYFAREFFERQRMRDAFWAFALLAALALTRSLFHVAWMCALVGVIAVARRDLRKKTLVASLVPTLAVVGWYVRTLLLFGSFAASSWLGMSAARITTEQGTMSERTALVDKGELSRFATISPFQPLERYAPLLEGRSTPRARALSEVPALARRDKTNGHSNLNHIDYLEVAAAYEADALRVLRAHPEWYLRGLRSAFTIFFHPVSRGEFLADNRARIGAWDSLYNLAHWPRHAPVALFFFGVLLWSLVFLWRAARRRQLGEMRALLVLVLTLHVLFVFGVGNALEVGENNRFRYLTLPPMLTIFALLLASTRERSGSTREAKSIVP